MGSETKICFRLPSPEGAANPQFLMGGGESVQRPLADKLDNFWAGKND